MRLPRRVGIAALSTWLPDAVETTAEAVRDGRLSPEDAAGTGVDQVPVSHTVPAPDMAVHALSDALAAAAWRPEQITMLTHAWVYHQGHDFWSPAHYVAHRAGAAEAVPLGLQQMSNGGAAGLAIAAAAVAQGPGGARVAVTTADRFARPGFDRWGSDYAVAYGDGATAALVHRLDVANDVLELVSLATATASGMEVMHRGADPFTPAPRSLSATVDVKRAKKAFLADGGMERFFAVARQKVRDVLTRALADAGLRGDDERLRAVLLPRLGPATLDLMYLPVVQDVVKASPLSPGTRTGHLGAGDLLANLDILLTGGLLAGGQFALVVGGGGGFSWTAAVVRRPSPPA